MLNSSFGVQLYSIRDLLDVDTGHTLHRLAEAGYRFVEPSTTEQLVELAPLLDDLGLRVQSCHYDFAHVVEANTEREVLARMQAVVDQAQALGVTCLVFPYLKPEQRETPSDYRRLADRLNLVGELTAARGIKHAYHHHNFEFAPLAETRTSGWDVLCERLDRRLTRLQLDVFWVAVAGLDPLAFLEEHESWIDLVHLKDLRFPFTQTFDEQGVTPSAFRALGQGGLALESILSFCARLPRPIALTIEQDFGTLILEELAASARYLKVHLPASRT